MTTTTMTTTTITMTMTTMTMTTTTTTSRGAAEENCYGDDYQPPDPPLKMAGVMPVITVDVAVVVYSMSKQVFSGFFCR